MKKRTKCHKVNIAEVGLLYYDHILRYFVVAVQMSCEPGDAEADEADLLFMPRMNIVLHGNNFTVSRVESDTVMGTAVILR